ncbi:hypothetical protein ACFQGX_50030 [Nonomuraea dietziae]|uniref:hypothetical protein n=1 Tax=Nonomuraea dietziae TaxID=65515 RepID=UPI003606736A
MDALGIFVAQFDVAQLVGQEGDMGVEAVAGDQQCGDRVGAVGIQRSWTPVCATAR